MTAIVICLGAMAGLGIWCLAAATRPAVPDLAAQLAALEAEPAASIALPGTSDSQFAIAARAGSWLSRHGLPSKTTSKALETLGRDREAFLARITAQIAITVAATATAGLLLSAVAGIAWVTPVWASLAAAAIVYTTACARICAEATTVRGKYRHALAVYLDLVVISLSGGAGIEQALRDAADEGSGPQFAAIRRCLEISQVTRTPIWTNLSKLGDRIQVAEYSQLAATVGLAGDEGAKIRASLTARAATLRTSQLHSAEAEAGQATERMSLPIVCLFGAFLLLLMYPAVSAILTGL